MGTRPRRLGGATLFVEYSVGKNVATALRASGVTVVWHQDVLADDATDDAYLGRCAREGWIPLTGDSDVHTLPLQRHLIRQARLRVFRLTRNHWPWKDKRDAFVAALPSIEELLRKHPKGPFIARINREGKVTSLEYL